MFCHAHFLDGSFPRSIEYRNGGADPAVHEANPSFRLFPYRERHLQCLWADSGYRPALLKTTEGEEVRVEHPGEFNLGPGPDFLRATLLIGKEHRRVVGDLEIHIHPSGWKSHGHAEDPAFGDVRFHVVYFQGPEIPGLIQIPLQPLLSSNPCFSFENIDIAAYPYSIPSGDFPLRTLHPDAKTEFLESAGEERLRLKAERLVLAMQSKEPEQVLWEELLAALGYKSNKRPFRKLANALPLPRLKSLASTPDEAYALLLGLSGLLPTNPDPAWSADTRTFIRKTWDCWWKQPEELKEEALQRTEWKPAGIRPANHPVRRMMAAAHYAFRLPELIEEPAWLVDFPDNFWNTHITWKRTCEPTALVGKARASAIVTNILVPYKAATGNTDLNLDNLPPEPGNSIMRQTAYTLFGPDHSHKVYRSALARQGLIQIFNDHIITHQLDKLREKAGS